MYNTYITFARKYKLFAIRILHSIKHTLQISGGRVSLDGMPPLPYHRILNIQKTVTEKSY